MSVLNDIKKIRKLIPNDLEFADAITKYINSVKTCCNNPDNNVKEENPLFGVRTVCKKCGKVLYGKE